MMVLVVVIVVVMMTVVSIKRNQRQKRNVADIRVSPSFIDVLTLFSTVFSFTVNATKRALREKINRSLRGGTARRV